VPEYFWAAVETCINSSEFFCNDCQRSSHESVFNQCSHYMIKVIKIFVSGYRTQEGWPCNYWSDLSEHEDVPCPMQLSVMKRHHCHICILVRCLVNFSTRRDLAMWNFCNGIMVASGSPRHTCAVDIYYLLCVGHKLMW